MPDMENVISDIEQQIRWIEEIECHKFPGWLNVTNAMRDAIVLLKVQEQIVRCKDCKWWDKKEQSSYGYCHAMKHGYHSEYWEIGIYRKYKADFFCADGEEKEGGET